MTSHKSFKSRTRARMAKTGERYTTARRRLLDKAGTQPASPAEVVRTVPTEALEAGGPGATADGSRATADGPGAAADGPGATAGGPGATADGPADGVRALRLVDASVRERTGRTGDEWFVLLDAWGATGRRHPEIARWLMTEHGVDGWWSQSITVAYEQARGMRAAGQSADGSFATTVTRTVAAPLDRVYQAFAEAAVRERWLPGVRLGARPAAAPRWFRADWPEDASRIAVGFTAKGDARTQVALAHERLPDARTAARMKAYWRERLATLARMLEP